MLTHLSGSARDGGGIYRYNGRTMASLPLNGRIALITGASQRIGRALALSLAGAGAAIAVHYGNDRLGAESTAEEARRQGAKAITLQADLSQADQAACMIEEVESNLGVPTILINNASIFEAGGIHDTDPHAWQRHLAVNLTAPFMLCRAFARACDGNQGVILNMLDWRALHPGPDHLAYTVAKAGLAALTVSLAQSLAPKIRVNGLALGAILPPPGHSTKDPALIAGVPAQRWGEVEEVCQAAYFLIAGPDYITGEILHIDGGRHLL
jgi:NAD(P)-dependent dehydrogenase (short-subunit alcohol dehydrogenase family)